MSGTYEKRLLTGRDRGNGLLTKLWQIPWSFVLLIGLIAFLTLVDRAAGRPAGTVTEVTR